MIFNQKCGKVSQNHSLIAPIYFELEPENLKIYNNTGVSVSHRQYNDNIKLLPLGLLLVWLDSLFIF